MSVSPPKLFSANSGSGRHDMTDDGFPSNFGASRPEGGARPGASRLGRGLAALLGDVGDEKAALARARGQRRVPVAFLRPNPHNPRQRFDATDLEDLAASVRERGVLQPILVRPVAGDPDAYEIIAGERRWRAAQQVRLHDVPVIVLEANDREALELAIIENVQREDLNAIEEAAGYQRLIDEFAYSQNELANAIGKSRSHVANTLRLLKLPESVKAKVAEGKITAGHARALLSLPNPEEAAEAIAEGRLTVRDAESMARLETKSLPGMKPARHPDADTLAIERSLSDILGLHVFLRHGERGGELRIRYRTLEQLDDLCRRLKG